MADANGNIRDAGQQNSGDSGAPHRLWRGRGTDAGKVASIVAVVGSQYSRRRQQLNEKVPAYGPRTFTRPSGYERNCRSSGSSPICSISALHLRTYFQLDGVAKAVNLHVQRSRTITPAQPFAVYGGLRSSYEPPPCGMRRARCRSPKRLRAPRRARCVRPCSRRRVHKRHASRSAAAPL